MNCPTCNSDAGFRVVAGSGRDSETGYYDEDFYVCNSCGEAWDAQDLARIQERSERRIDAQSACGGLAEKENVA